MLLPLSGADNGVGSSGDTNDRRVRTSGLCQRDHHHPHQYGNNLMIDWLISIECRISSTGILTFYRGEFFFLYS